MKKQNIITISRPLYHRLTDLTNALMIIRDSLDGLTRGRKHSILNIYNQLRSLIAEKSGDNPSLLFDVAKKLNKELTVFYKPKMIFPGEIKEKTMISFELPGLTVDRPEAWQQEISLADFLTKKILYFNGREYTSEELVRHVANQAGGSHYPSKVTQEIANLFSVLLTPDNLLVKNGFPNVEALKDYMCELAQVVLKLGHVMLSSVSNFELYINVYLPKQKLEKNAYLIDFYHDQMLNRLSVFVDLKGRPTLKLTDSSGVGILVPVEKSIVSGQYYLLNVSFRLLPDFKTRIKIEVNGVAEYEDDIDYVFDFRNDLQSFKVFHNRSLESEQDGMTFGILQAGVFSKYHETADRTDVLATLGANPETKIPLFKRGLYRSRNTDGTLSDSEEIPMVAIKDLPIEV